LKVVVFVDGCFWHGCPRHSRTPATNPVFWRTKIDRNRARDREVNRELRGRGWKVVRIWHHELKRKSENRLLAKLTRHLDFRANRPRGS
jgi:DNA mismatch endonuclease (patch repair protein)